MASEINQVIRNMRKEGFDFERTTSNHWKVYHRARYVGTMPTSPSDRMSIMACMRDISREVGFPLDINGRIDKRKLKKLQAETPDTSGEDYVDPGSCFPAPLPEPEKQHHAERQELERAGREVIAMMAKKAGRPSVEETNARRHLLADWFRENPEFEGTPTEVWERVKLDFGYDVGLPAMRTDLYALETEGLVGSAGNVHRRWGYRLIPREEEAKPLLPPEEVDTGITPIEEDEVSKPHGIEIDLLRYEKQQDARLIFGLKMLARMKGATDEELEWVEREARR